MPGTAGATRRDPASSVIIKTVIVVNLCRTCLSDISTGNN